jgi:hypothetical protein
MPGLMRGGWKRGRVSGPPSLRCSVWTAPDHHGYRASLLLYVRPAKLMTTCRWKSGQRRDQATFVAARRRSGRPGRRSAGSSPPLGGCKPPVRSMKRSLPRREWLPLRGPTGSRARTCRAKAREGVKRLAMQHRRTLRRKGRGTVAQPSWEQERPVSAPAVSLGGCQPARGLGGANSISGIPVKRASAERESEWPVVLPMPGTTQPWGREGATLGLRADWR